MGWKQGLAEARGLPGSQEMAVNWLRGQQERKCGHLPSWLAGRSTEPCVAAGMVGLGIAALHVEWSPWELEVVKGPVDRVLCQGGESPCGAKKVSG